MAGHTRQFGQVVCPGSLPSPPDSPNSFERDLPPVPFQQAEFENPEASGSHHLFYPNWIEPAPRLLALPPTPNSYRSESGSSVSLVSTELNYDGISIKADDDEDDNSTTSTDDALVDLALSTSIPLASIFYTPKEDIADVCKTAERSGLHTGLMRRPGARTDGKSNVNRFGERENSWWVVMGRNADAVKQMVNKQQTGMPGFFHPDSQLVEVNRYSSPAFAAFLQTILAGFIGGFAVLFGLGRML